MQDSHVGKVYVHLHTFIAIEEFANWLFCFICYGGYGEAHDV